MGRGRHHDQHGDAGAGAAVPSSVSTAVTPDSLQSMSQGSGAPASSSIRTASDRNMGELRS